MNPRFSEFDREDVRDLIAQYPLAWVLSDAHPASPASLLPLFGEFSEDGVLISLIGHMAKSNPLNRAFSSDSAGTILFCGPQAYVSPSHARRKSWAPTWNYASLKITAQVEMNDELTDHALAELIIRCEAGKVEPWQSSELGERYDSMRRAIIGFEATVTSIEGTFKLAQDEDNETFENIIENHPDSRLRDWMIRLNSDRDA